MKISGLLNEESKIAIGTSDESVMQAKVDIVRDDAPIIDASIDSIASAEEYTAEVLIDTFIGTIADAEDAFFKGDTTEVTIYTSIDLTVKAKDDLAEVSMYESMNTVVNTIYETLDVAEPYTQDTDNTREECAVELSNDSNNHAEDVICNSGPAEAVFENMFDHTAEDEVVFETSILHAQDKVVTLEENAEQAICTTSRSVGIAVDDAPRKDDEVAICTSIVNDKDKNYSDEEEINTNIHFSADAEIDTFMEFTDGVAIDFSIGSIVESNDAINSQIETDVQDDDFSKATNCHINDSDDNADNLVSR